MSRCSHLFPALTLLALLTALAGGVSLAVVALLAQIVQERRFTFSLLTEVNRQHQERPEDKSLDHG